MITKFPSGSPTTNVQTGTTYTLLGSDNGNFVTFNNASAVTVTVPAGLPANFACVCVQLGAGTVGFTGSGTTLHNRQSFASIAGQYGEASVYQYASNVFILAGDMTT